MARATLVFVAGASPQIITETAYALLRSPMPITDVHVLTTAAGRRIIEERLFGRERRWSSFVRVHPRARQYRFSPRRIVMLRDAQGRALEDVRSADDNAAAADQIARFVREHTSASDPPLHASIAGGRKTMGYLLAAAMLLYGRPEDRLSHVLVRPASLEGTDFFFPVRARRGVLRFRGPEGRRIDVAASAIAVGLAELPFPRLRGVKGLGELPALPFSAVVAELQTDLDALIRPRVRVHRAENAVDCGGRTVRLSPVQTEIYAMLAERRQRGCGLEACSDCPRCFLPTREIAGEFHDELSRRMRVKESSGVGPTWGERNFEPEVSKINDKLRRALHGASERYEIAIRGVKGHRLYGIALPPAALTIEP
jgi:CRISPR-associated protein (TIGR02584 family)